MGRREKGSNAEQDNRNDQQRCMVSIGKHVQGRLCCEQYVKCTGQEHARPSLLRERSSLKERENSHAGRV